MLFRRKCGNWVLLVGLGAGTGLALHCELPSQHQRVDRDTSCVACHGAEYQSAQQPLHSGLIALTCEECHGNTAWKPARGGNHSWALLGAHATTPCYGCHVGDPPLYEGTSSACVDCHRAERDTAREPPHDALSEQCNDCHTSQAWQPASFEHEWPLDGAHATATCDSCHGEPPSYDGTPASCVACHEAERATAINPPHDGLSTECQTCHGTASWGSAELDHTAFPLTGAHATASCEGCHVGTPVVFAGTPSECVSCHRRDYDGSTFPGHGEFPTTCAGCHTTDGWVPATGGGHPQDRFSITGRHDYACNECHNAALGSVNGAGNADCVGCHEGEHSLARMDDEHDDVGDYPRGAGRSQNFCLACHPRGTE